MPVTAAPATRTSDPGVRSLGASMAGVTDRPSVLVVEDDAAIAELVQLYLDGAGYAVRVAGDAEAGRRGSPTRRPTWWCSTWGSPGRSTASSSVGSSASRAAHR